MCLLHLINDILVDHAGHLPLATIGLNCLLDYAVRLSHCSLVVCSWVHLEH